jgi:hypothetical protein
MVALATGPLEFDPDRVRFLDVPETEEVHAP